MRQGRETIKMTETLRNNLAHAQDIATMDWLTIVRLAENLDRVLDRCSKLRTQTHNRHQAAGD